MTSRSNGTCGERLRAMAGVITIAVAGFVYRRLLRACPRGAHGFLLCVRGELQIDRVDAHTRLPALDGLPRIHQPFQHLAGHAEPEVTLHPGSNDARE